MKSVLPEVWELATKHMQLLRVRSHFPASTYANFFYYVLPLPPSGPRPPLNCAYVHAYGYEFCKDPTHKQNTSTARPCIIHVFICSLCLVVQVLHFSVFLLCSLSPTNFHSNRGKNTRVDGTSVIPSALKGWKIWDVSWHVVWKAN